MLPFRTIAAPSLAVLALTLAALPICASDHTPPPSQAATSYAAVEVHENEHVAIAAEPYDSKKKESLFRIDYWSHGVLPVRLIVTNNSDHPISLKEARIYLITRDGDKIPTAEPEDVERRMSMKDRTGSRIPLPAPLPGIHTAGKANDKKVEQDFDQFEYSTITVAPHTTTAGFLFYDVSGISDPLRGMKLHLHKLLNADNQELFLFEIPFDRYLQSKSAQMN